MPIQNYRYVHFKRSDAYCTGNYQIWREFHLEIGMVDIQKLIQNKKNWLLIVMY